MRKEAVIKEAVIKEITIGTGRPLICVPVVEQTGTQILESIKKLAGTRADMIEWRIDWYEDAQNQDRVCQMIAEISKLLPGQLLLCTFRSKAQGGEGEISAEDYTRLLQKIAASGCADLVDVEVCRLTKPQGLVRELKEQGIWVVASDHDFHKTPPVDIMVEKLLYMKRIGANIGKLAVMPEGKRDVLRLLEATAAVKEAEPQYPVITMAMGREGVVSRLGGEIFGSCVTFASAGKSSAPGQMPLEDVAVILDKISSSMEISGQN